MAGAWAAGALNWNSSGTLSVTWLWSAWRGQGVITQTAGTVDVYYLDFGLPITSAVYNLDGGELWVSAMGYAASPGYNAPATLNFGGGTLVATADFTPTASSGYALLYTIDEGATALIDTNGHNVTLPGVVSGLGGLEKFGSGTLTLSGANTYAGGTTVDEGTLAVGNADAIPAGADKGDVEVDGTLDLGGFGIALNGLNGYGTLTSGVSGSCTVSVGDNDASTAFYGTIEDGAGTLGLTKIGDGMLTLSGECTYSGDTTLTAGALSPKEASQPARSSLTAGSCNGAPATTRTCPISSPPSAAGSSPCWTPTATTSRWRTAISGDGGVEKLGDGTLTLSGTNDYAGGTLVERRNPRGRHARRAAGL